MRRALLALLLLATVGAICGWLLLREVGTAAHGTGPAAQELRLTVAGGSSLRAVLQDLEGLGAIHHARLFEIYLRCCAPQYAGRAVKIKAGEYLIAAGSSPLAIIDQLAAGRVILEQLTIVEGWSFAQMRTALDAHPRLAHTLQGRTAAQVMQALGHSGEPAEGRFFPDTYRFAAGTADLEILRLAYARLAGELAAAWAARLPDLPFSTPAQALTLASIVEKETGLASERRRIAGVFVNRLRVNMRMQSDPTVIYGLGQGYDGNIRSRDLVTDTPYNTYTRSGLPPTPIALPGKDAIWAAVQPEQTDDFYFVATGDGDGSHHFSATLEQHNAALRRFLTRTRQGRGP